MEEEVIYRSDFYSKVFLDMSLNNILDQPK